MLGIKLPKLAGVQRAEIWGIVIIACFNLAFLSVVLRFGNLSPGTVLLIAIFGQLFVTGVIVVLLRLRAGRDRIEDNLKLSELIKAALSDIQKDNTERTAALLKILEKSPCPLTKKESEDHD